MYLSLRLTLITILICLLPLNVGAADKWTTLDTALEATALTLHVMDWGTTLHGARNPGHYKETNQILGEHPSTDKVNIYFLTTGLLMPVVSYYLPEGWRTAWQVLRIGIEGWCVGQNYSAGLRVRF